MRDLINVTVTVNGTRYERAVEPRMLLSDFLRHELGLTGTHVGCEHGVCGTCTVVFDGPGRVLGRAASPSGGLPGRSCSAMCLLHAWLFDDAGPFSGGESQPH